MQYFSAVRSLHSLSEAVLLKSLALFGLIGSKHFCYLLKRKIGRIFANRAKILFTPSVRITTIIINTIKNPDCQGFLRIFCIY